MKQTVEDAANEYCRRHIADLEGLVLSMVNAFKAGAEWAEKNKTQSKVMCLIDKTKICNQCHECDVHILNPNY